MADKNDPNFQGSRNEREPENYYQLLGCDELNSKEQINAEFKKKALKFHPDKNNDDNRMFQRLQKARDILCNDSTRKSYDCWRKGGLKEFISFDDWLKFNTQSHLHWGQPPKKRMLTESSGSVTTSDSTEENKIYTTKSYMTGWGCRSSLKRKFQNYEI